MRTGLSSVWARARHWIIAVCVSAVLLITAVTGDHEANLPAVGYALVVISGLALGFGRKAPVPVLIVAGLCALGYNAIGFDVPAVAYLFAVYMAVRSGHRLVTVIISVAMLVCLPLAIMASPADGAAKEALAQARSVLELAWLIAAGAAGEALRQAERRADEAERTREETARLRATQERLHIARELHDSLTHQISIIKVQSEVAVHLARKRGEEIPESLLAIQQASREATRELRATLETLRAGNETPPSHGLDHLPELLAGARGIGLTTTLSIEGERQDVPDAVDRTAYRIVQESLTNTARHSGAATASIKIHYRPDGLAIRIDDDGSAKPGAKPVPGVGLLGMQERVTALGGRLRAEPRTEGGFTVQAELPVAQIS